MRLPRCESLYVYRVCHIGKPTMSDLAAAPDCPMAAEVPFKLVRTKYCVLRWDDGAVAWAGHLDVDKDDQPCNRVQINAISSLLPFLRQERGAAFSGLNCASR